MLNSCVNWKDWVFKWGTQLGHFFGWLAKWMIRAFLGRFWQSKEVLRIVCQFTVYATITVYKSTVHFHFRFSICSFLLCSESNLKLRFFGFSDTFFHQGNLKFPCFNNKKCYELNIAENHNILQNEIIENKKMSQLT